MKDIITINEEIIITSEEKTLIKVVEKASGILYKTIISSKRDADIVLARNILGYLLRKKTLCTYKRAGWVINRHHSSVVAYEREFDKNYKFYPEYKRVYNKALNIYDNNHFTTTVEMRLIQTQILEIEKSIRRIKRDIQC
tara:strand:+ start:408 stop:827 length:420 start_codon:yes stop_codon:yes gene_type:complete